MRIDFGRAADDYARHRAGFPDEFFDRLAARGIRPSADPGNRALDLGTGTGALGRGLARRGWRVTGLDRSAAMLTAARELDREAGVHIDYLQAGAESTGLGDGAFALVTAGTCWHWFERPRAATEARRLLHPGDRPGRSRGGWLVIAALDWVPRPGSVVAETVRLIAQHNPAWQGSDASGFRWSWRHDVAAAGFVDLDRFAFDLDIPYSHAGWRGRIRASAGIAASLDASAVARFDAAHGELLAARFPTEPMRVPHRVSALLARAPGR